MQKEQQIHDVTGLPYSDFSLSVFHEKYSARAPDGTILDFYPQTALSRVAEAVYNNAFLLHKDKLSEDDMRQLDDDIYCALRDNGGVPAGRILANAGTRNFRGSLINCTVSGNIEDSMEDILEKVKEAGLTLRSGAGIGYCFSTLRPREAKVTGVGARTSGPIKFMDVFDAMTATISAGGGRRGAQMGTFWVYHPDILEFIEAKKQDGRLRTFNVSVLVDDEFMEAVNNDSTIRLVFPKLSSDTDENVVDGYYPGIYPRYGRKKKEGKLKVYREVKAREIWERIMQSTYEGSEPGILNYSRINEYNPLNFMEELIATNPCGEIPLPEYGACNLGSLNLVKYIEFNKKDRKYTFDFDTFELGVYTMSIFLDCICDMSNLPLEKQRDEILLKRRHGLGFMGLGSVLCLLNIRYGSRESLEFIEKLMRLMVKWSVKANMDLADLLGPSRILKPNSEGLRNYLNTPFMKSIKDLINYDEILNTGLRYTHSLAIAPTGTIALSIGNNVSNGIEPSFRHSYIRNKRNSGRRTLSHETVQSYEYRRILHDFGEFPKEWKSSFVTASDLTPEDHLRVQSLVQKYVDNSVSKTINVPSSISFDDFKNVYKIAYDSGCKGCTTFRFNPDIFQGILMDVEELSQSMYSFKTKDGRQFTLSGETIVRLPDGEECLAANLYAALKEGYFFSKL